MTSVELSDLTAAGVISDLDTGALIHAVTGGSSRSAQVGWLSSSTALFKSLADDTGTATFLTTLGFSARGISLATDTGNSTSLTSLGVSSFMQTVLDDADATTARATLEIQDADSGLVNANVTDTLSVGYSAEVYSAGTFDTGAGAGTYTPNEANGNFQSAVNGGPHTLAPPTNNCSLVIQYSNEATPGTVTTSGFTKTSGDNLTTDTGSDFMVYITKNNGFSHLHIQALQ